MVVIWWLSSHDCLLMTVAWWLSPDDCCLMTVAWWLSSDDCRLMTVTWWLSPDDCRLMTVTWWLSPDDCQLMTVAWWLQLQNYSTAQLIYLHLSTEPPPSTPTSTLHNKLCPVEQSKRFDLLNQIYVVQYFGISTFTTHYHLKLQANPKQNCPKNETKFSCGSFLKFSVRLFEVDFDLHFLLPTLKK